MLWNECSGFDVFLFFCSASKFWWFQSNSQHSSAHTIFDIWAACVFVMNFRSKSFVACVRLHYSRSFVSLLLLLFFSFSFQKVFQRNFRFSAEFQRNKAGWIKTIKWFSIALIIFLRSKHIRCVYFEAFFTLYWLNAYRLFCIHFKQFYTWSLKFAWRCWFCQPMPDVHTSTSRFK